VDRFCERDGGIQFDLVLGARENFFKGADHFRVVEQRFRVRPDRMVFVGDSLKDAERALACGVSFIGKVGTFTRREFEARFGEVTTIENLSQLLDIFQ